MQYSLPPESQRSVDDEDRVNGGFTPQGMDSWAGPSKA